MAQQQNLHKFVLGSKDFDNKTSEFSYDHGWYAITDINGEERSEIYRSRNAQEAYMKWNVYIGRKKERPIREDRGEDRNYQGNHAGRRQSYSERRRRVSEGDRLQSAGSGERRKSVYNEDREESSSREKRTEKKQNSGTQRDEKHISNRKKNSYQGKNSCQGKSSYQGKSNRSRKPRKQYKRQDNKVTSFNWDDMD